MLSHFHNKEKSLDHLKNKMVDLFTSLEIENTHP